MRRVSLNRYSLLLVVVALLPIQSADSQPLSIQFQDIDVRRALQILAEKTEQNILVSDAVSGRLSVNLQEVSWRQAMDLILLAHNLAEQRIGEALLIAPAEQIAAAQQSQLQHLKDLQQVKPLSTALLQVRYAQASALAELMAGKGNRFITKRRGGLVGMWCNTLVGSSVSVRHAFV